MVLRLINDLNKGKTMNIQENISCCKTFSLIQYR